MPRGGATPTDNRPGRGLGVLVLWLAAWAGTGCEGSHDLVVDLETDLRPGYEFHSVHASLSRPDGTLADEATLLVTHSDTFIPPARAAEFERLPPGDYMLRLELRGPGLRGAVREAPIELDTSAYERIQFQRICLTLQCPLPSDPEATQCLSNRCVLPSCTPQHPENCPAPACRADADCGEPTGCVRPRCREGECFETTDDQRCAADAYCDGATRACLPSPIADAGPFDSGPLDSGPFDSGPLDAGPTCTPDMCDDGDPCTRDLCSEDRCTHAPLCGDAEYCFAGRCAPEPTLSIATTSSPGCIDLGVDYSGGEDFTYRRITRGRANAPVQQTNEHVSCRRPPLPDDMPYTLDGGGNHTFSFYSGRQTDCFAPIYGRWLARAEVDGRASPPVSVTYYNSGCPGIGTCDAARTHCSPCIDCIDGEYCAGASGCAPIPSLTIETSDGPGCVDLGVPHGDPPATLTTIRGRPGATSTQYNTHVSCGRPAEAADIRVLDGSGRAVAALPTGILLDCSSANYGRFDVHVEVDGQRSNTVPVTYYNSRCPSVATCDAASTVCTR